MPIIIRHGIKSHILSIRIHLVMMIAFILFLNFNWWTIKPSTILLKIATQDISKCISECIEKILCNVIFHTENEPYFLTHQCESLIDFL